MKKDRSAEGAGRKGKNCRAPATPKDTGEFLAEWQPGRVFRDRSRRELLYLTLGYVVILGALVGLTAFLLSG